MNKSSVIAIAVLLGLSNPLLADDTPDVICKSAAELAKEGDLEGALEEARWCVTLLEQMQQNQVTKYFPDEVKGFTGNELEQQNAMGFQMTSRHYTNGEKSISVSLNGGSTGSAMDAFSAIASFGMQAGGGEKVRIQRRTGQLIKDSGDLTLTITMKSGGVLVFETDSVDKAALKAFAKAFPIADLDDAIN